MNKNCENCGHSEEIEPYRDPKCPYMLCDTGEVVSRWMNCDNWKVKRKNDGQTEEMRI